MIEEALVKGTVQPGRRRKLLAWGQSGRAAWRSPYRTKFVRNHKIWVDHEEEGRGQVRQAGETA